MFGHSKLSSLVLFKGCLILDALNGEWRRFSMSFLQDIMRFSTIKEDMNVILQASLPPELSKPVELPGVAPCQAEDWLRTDDAYAQQMRYRIELLNEKPADTLWMTKEAKPATRELLTEALGILPNLGFAPTTHGLCCPDGRVVPINRDDPLKTLGHLVQEDLCILQKQGDEHVLSAAVLCFPANWKLADKAGRPLSQIHDPVEEYDANVSRRVQRLFDGVRAGRPMWRHNRLRYAQADLHQPRRISAERNRPYIRSERQCILRLPETNAVVFSIHTYVVLAV
ncbi:MAG: DUF3445 domain-containing protein [Sulfitobacter sp.]